MNDFIRLVINSSWSWRFERWLTHSGTTYLTGFRRRYGNLGRFLLDEPDVDYDEVPLVLWNRVPLYRYLRCSLVTPLSLQKCCRMVARRCLMAAGGRLFAKVDRLAYPASLKSYLKLQSD